MSEAAAEIVDVVRRVIGNGPRQLQRPPLSIALLEIDLSEQSITDFEAELVKFTRTQFAIALGSGTAALHCALMAAGVRQGDEVLCPSLTFAATANAICHAGAIPHFVDANDQTLGIHPFKLKQYLGSGNFRRDDNGCWNLMTHRRVAAIVPVHLLGIPCFIDQVRMIADYWGITVIEDAAEALGSYSPLGDHCGTIGKAGILSFNINKVLTTGGGGAVLTNDESLANKVRHISRQAKVAHPFLWKHDAVGWNYRMSPLGAALGLDGIKRLFFTLEKKQDLANTYAKEFASCSKAAMVGADGNRWLNAIALDPRCAKDRDNVIEALQANGFESRALFTPLHMLKHFQSCPRQQNLGMAEDLFNRVVCLPSTISASCSPDAAASTGS